MLRKIFLILAISGLVFFGLRFSLQAQRYTKEEPAPYPYDYTEDLGRIEAKVDKLSTSLDNTNKEILKKLDQVLSNQTKIISELEIVKVRASR